MGIARADFSDGLMWLPVKNQELKTVKKPLYYKGDTGSLMPFVSISIPNVFNSIVIPYENIVEFNYTVFGGETGTAEFIFTDTTPIFIETLIRKAYNKRVENPKEFRILVQYGWRIQNPTPEIQPFVIGDIESGSASGIYATPPIEFHMMDASWTYSTIGSTARLVLRTTSLNSLYAYNVDDQTTINTKKITDLRSLENVLSEFINSSIKAKPYPYKVIIESNDIKLDRLVKNPIAFESSDSINTALRKVVSKLYVPVEKKDERAGGEIYFHVGSTPIRDNTRNEIFYPVYIYEKEKPPVKLKNVPLIEYPAHESPVISFSPSLNMPQSVYLYKDKYSYINDIGERVVKSIEQEAITAGYISANGVIGQEVTVNKEGIPSDEVLTKPRSRSIIASIDIDMMGEPALSNPLLRYTDIEVRMADIAVEGMLLNKDDFFSNFKQIPPSNQILGGIFSQQNAKEIASALGGIVSERGLLPKIEAIPGDTSPFNGVYKITEVSHSINQSNGFITKLKLERFGASEG